MVVMLACAMTPSLSQETAEGPTDEKARRPIKEASEYLHRRMTDAALDSFKKRTSRMAATACHVRKR